MAVLQGSAKSVADGGFYPTEIAQSLRFNDNDSAYLSRTPSVAGNRKTWTFSAWVKRGNISNTQSLFVSGNTGNNYTVIAFLSSDVFYFQHAVSSTTVLEFTSNAVFRDPSAWYHVVFMLDTTQATNSNGMKLWVNGVLHSGTYGSYTQNTDAYINNTYAHGIAGLLSVTTNEFDGYMAEVHFTDGTAYDADDFGEFKSGVWVAKEPSVTYGTNGFYLDFADGGAIGDDESGNANDWTATNLASTDVMLDSPTNNFATLNAIDINTKHTFSEGNLKAVLTTGTNPRMTRGTQLVSSGKWYAEFTEIVSTSVTAFGIVDNTVSTDSGGVPQANSIIYFANGTVYRNATNVATYAASTIGDVIGVAMDLDGSTVEFFKNGVSLGTAINITTGTEYTFGAFANSSSDAFVVNFGQDSSFAGNETPQGNTDANGIGDFYYEPPTDYLALCTANLPEPAISPADGASPTDYMNTVLYTGDGNSSQAITGVGFAPDFVWVKGRSVAYSHLLSDVVRGDGNILFTNATNAEDTVNSRIDSLDSDGFTAGSDASANASGTTYVAWNWLAGGTAVSNTDGTITSSVSANTTSGFSIVSFTSQSGAFTVGHGLTAAPEIIITKHRNAAYNWWVLTTKVDGSLDHLELNSTAAIVNDTYGTALPTSTTFGYNYAYGGNYDMIAYCFHSVDGFSKVGSYVGNGSSTDGTFVYTGHSPSFVMFKRSDSAGSWIMLDKERDTYNVVDHQLLPNSSAAEATNDYIDFLSNGFKLRSSWSDSNANGGTYIFISFSSNPFKYSNAR